MGVIQREFESDSRDIEAWMLLPLAGLYAIGWMSYELMYKLGIKRPQQPHAPIVCIGNLRVGGSGKSPVVIHVAQVLQGQGREVVIGCNGYRSPRQEGASLAPAGPLDPKEWGDEPAMIREALPDVPLVVGRKRVDAAALVAAHHPGAVLLMDDGFQHLPLRKDVCIVLDPERPVNSFCLPAGPYREPRGAGRRKADLLLPNDQFSVQPYIQGIQWTQSPVPAPARVATLTAIAYPHRMVMTAEHLGYDVVSGVARPDHDPLDDPQLLSRIPADLPILTTAKDWVKIRQRPDVESRAWGILQYGVTIEPAAEFAEWLGARIAAK